MKKISLFILMLFILREANSQNYYFYQGNKITLQQRTDKLAVILNENTINFNKENLMNNLNSVLNFSDEVKEVGENYYLINFKNQKSAEEFDIYINNIISSDNSIKFVTPVYYGETKRVTQIPTDEFIVRLKNLKDKEFLEIINANNNVRIMGNISDEKGFLLKSNNELRKNAMYLSDLYFNSGLFEYAEPNFIYPEKCLFNSVPNDPYYNLQWALNNTGQLVPTGENWFGDQPFVNGIPGADMDVNMAWDYTTGSSSVIVGFLDTGIDSTHPDFQSAGHLLAGYDAFYNKNGVPRDSGFHGTGTAGFVGAVTNNSIGISGIAPGCKLISLKIYNASGSVTVATIVRAFDTARVRGIDILSNSWGGGNPNTSITNAINNAAINGRNGLGCIVFFASGNEGCSPPMYPSILEKVISVGATTPHDQRKAPGNGNQYYWGGNYGGDSNGDLDVVTPSNCYTTDVQGTEGYTSTDYNATFWGTSCSCPNAAGVAALILSVNTSQSRLQVIDKLYRGCDKIENVSYATLKTYGRWNEYFGYGRVNAYNSVRLAAGEDVTPPAIIHKNISSVTNTYPTNVSAEIIDQDGSSVPVSGINQPVLFFRYNKNNSGWSAFDSVIAFSNSGNIFNFKIPCIGFETQVQYYIRAGDNFGNTAFFPRGAPNPFWLCYFVVGTYTTSTNKINAFTALDGSVSYSPVVNFGNFNIVNTRIQIYLRHLYVSDEVIELYSPIADANNNRKCLFTSNGGSAQNITGAIVSDSANQFWNSGYPPYYNGLYKGDYLLHGLNGTNANGNWKILNFDRYAGGVPYFDSIRISFVKTSGTKSPSARLNSPEDSVLNFGEIIAGDSVTKNFYLKNDGTSDLHINSIYFTGSDSANFSLLSSLPAQISPADSGLFIVKYKTFSNLNSAGINSTIDVVENALMNIINDDPFKSVFRVSLQSDINYSTLRILNLKVLIQGFYNNLNNNMIQDSVRVFIRSISSPYEIEDSSLTILSSTGDGLFGFNNISNGVNYYIELIHRNSILTWSRLPGQIFINDTLNFDFTSDISQAFGNNLIIVDNSPLKFAIYGGDIDRDGAVDISDLSLIENDASNFTEGYMLTDINGDEFIDLSDLSIADNNAADFVAEIKP